MPHHDLPQGFRFAAVQCGVRPDRERKDLVLAVSDRPAAAAGTFTQNRVVAAPVRVCRERLPSAQARGVVICAGNANACTGKQGMADARRMAVIAAQGLLCPAEQILVASTGVIGRPLPMDNIERGIRQAAGQLRGDVNAFREAAEAIWTTDTRLKLTQRSLAAGGQEVRLAGFAKGAAMIGPNMATMLAFLFSDARVSPENLQSVLRCAVNRSFNCISVEGHTSTNDTVLVFANGAAEGPELKGQTLANFADAVEACCSELARAIAEDAEGISHLIVLDVEGLPSDDEARRIAKAVAESALVKTAVFGADPNWGRIVSAAGYAGVEFEERDLSLWLGDLLLYEKGTPQSFDERAAAQYLKTNREVRIRLVFARGQGRCRFYTCDLGYEYVRLNAEYTT